MARFIFACIAMATALLTPVAPCQAATVVTWTGSNDFDTEELLFTGFTANAVTLISGEGYLHDHGEDRLFSMSVLLNGTWTEIANSGQTHGESGDVFLSTIPFPFFFTSGDVAGLRLAVDLPVGFANHNMLGEQFTFDLTETPLPAALPMFGSGLGLVSLFGWWRRRRAVAV